MAGLFRNNEATQEGKYLVKRRDGTIPVWPSFVLGARDPAAAAALRSYSKAAKANGIDLQYCTEVMTLAAQFDEYRAVHGVGEPDTGYDLIDDPDIVAEMQQG